MKSIIHILKKKNSLSSYGFSNGFDGDGFCYVHVTTVCTYVVSVHTRNEGLHVI